MESEIKLNIESCVTRQLAVNLKPDYSLLGGCLGQVLYLFFSSECNDEKYERACSYLDKVLMSVRRRPLLPTYCNGVAGLCVGLICLEKYGFLEDISEAIGVYDTYLTDSLNKIIKYDLDFLHGAIGIGIYFIKKASFDDSAIDKIVAILDYLEEHSIRNDNGWTFWLYPNRFRQLEQNLSISHGICSTAMFVARAYKVMRTDANREKCIRLLQGIGRYLTSHLNDPNIYGCYTPALPEGGKTRLGWCYGDMGTSMALRAIGEITGDKAILELSYEIALFTALNRIDLTADGIHDASMCHGSSGVAHFFYNCFLHYGNPEFLNAFERWRRITLDMYDYLDNEKMFGFFHYDTLRKQKCLNILEGDTGVGLMLMRQHEVLDDLLLYEY